MLTDRYECVAINFVGGSYTITLQAKCYARAYIVLEGMTAASLEHFTVGEEYTLQIGK